MPELRNGVSRLALLGVVAGALATGQQALAQQAPAPPAATQTPAPAQAQAPTPAQSQNNVAEVVVTARRLDAAREAIEPSLGATTYSLSNQLVNILPAGENVQLNQVLLQAPGVVQDSFGQLHVRDDHGDLQYRIDNVILPEGLQVFGQTLSPRIASNIQLITGALPAQYGLQTAGIVNITTKSGFQNGGQMSIYGGSHDMYEPSAEYGGSWGANSLFVSGSYTHTGVGIESPDDSALPLHDASNQYQAFAFFDHVLNDTSKISFLAGTSQSTFQIPNPHGLQPSFAQDNGITGLGPGGALLVNGQSQFLSNDLNERQTEGTTFAAASYLYSGGDLTLQASLFGRYSTLVFDPDELGDLLYNGIAQYADKTDAAGGLQLEGSWQANPDHTVRGGVIIQGDRATSDTTSQVVPVASEPSGAIVQTSDVPLTIVDNSAKTSWTYSAYLQDEWKLLPQLTLNYGLRFDALNSYRNEDQWSPRANLVWTPFSGTTLHVGYARYFTPPPFELVASESIAKFAGTTAAPAVLEDSLPYADRQNYYDIGAQQKFGALTLGVDGYDRQDHDLLDEGQFGAPIILTPFNYQTGYARGVELSATYTHGPLSLYANGSIEKAQGREIVSSQFNFSPGELAYIAGNDIYLDHNQTYTASAGASYRLGTTRLSSDLLFGSGLRADDINPVTGQDIPNGEHLPSYLQVNFSLVHDFASTPAGPISVRADLINAFDKSYEIRNGTGVGVGAPQWGPRRGLFVGVTKHF
jgi:outer membrane receptor protein involved in Fe transport